MLPYPLLNAAKTEKVCHRPCAVVPGFAHVSSDWSGQPSADRAPFARPGQTLEHHSENHRQMHQEKQSLRAGRGGWWILSECCECVGTIFETKCARRRVSGDLANGQSHGIREALFRLFFAAELQKRVTIRRAKQGQKESAFRLLLWIQDKVFGCWAKGVRPGIWDW